MGNLLGAPLGLAGFGVMLPLCVPLDLYFVPLALWGDRDAKETAIMCHTIAMGAGYCAGYDAGAWAFSDGKPGGPCH